MGEGDTWLNAIIGAAITVLFSFTGFSPLIGGGVAGYLQRGTRKDGAKVGALSGALAFLPFVFLFLVVIAFVGAPFAGGGFGGPGYLDVLLILFVVLPLFLLWNVGLGAAGGYLGVYLRTELETSNG